MPPARAGGIVVSRIESQTYDVEETKPEIAFSFTLIGTLN